MNAHASSLSLQKSLDKFCEWCSTNKLSINTKNNKLMAFGSRLRVKKAKKVKVFMNGDKLQQVPTFKYLGLVLDCTTLMVNRVEWRVANTSRMWSTCASRQCSHMYLCFIICTVYLCSKQRYVGMLSNGS